MTVENHHPPSPHATPELFWSELREAAVGAVTRGWPVVPGTHPAENGWQGRDGATGLCPLHEDWQDRPVTNWEQAHAMWARRSFGVLLVCGRGVDVLELPARLAADALPALRTPGLAGPVAVLDPAQWLLFLASGAGLLPKMGAWPSVAYRGVGQWVPLPPTDLGRYRAHWQHPPEPGDVLPASAAVQRAVIDALGGGGSS